MTDMIGYLDLPECQDELHDQCPEQEASVLVPGRLLICTCSCHD
jgi:hypothetical protein